MHGWLVVFYGISTLVCYLMPNPVYIYGPAEYTDCISEEGQDSPNECPGYDTKQSDGKASVMLALWGMQSTSSLPCSQVHSALEW